MTQPEPPAYQVTERDEWIVQPGAVILTPATAIALRELLAAQDYEAALVGIAEALGVPAPPPREDW